MIQSGSATGVSILFGQAVAMWIGCFVLVAPVNGTALERPRAITAFIARREQCDHFRGEDPYDAARAQYLARQMKRYCTGTDRALKQLRARYARSPRIMKRLNRYERTVE